MIANNSQFIKKEIDSSLMCDEIQVISDIILASKLEITAGKKERDAALLALMRMKLGCNNDLLCEQLYQKECETLTVNNAECSLCVFEIDNDCNSFAKPLDEGVAYTNRFLTNILSPCQT